MSKPKYRLQLDSWKVGPRAHSNVYTNPPDGDYFSGHIETPIGIIFVSGRHAGKDTNGQFFLKAMANGQVHVCHGDPCPSGRWWDTALATVAHKWLKELSDG